MEVHWESPARKAGSEVVGNSDHFCMGKCSEKGWLRKCIEKGDSKVVGRSDHFCVGIVQRERLTEESAARKSNSKVFDLDDHFCTGKVQRESPIVKWSESHTIRLGNDLCGFGSAASRRKHAWSAAPRAAQCMDAHAGVTRAWAWACDDLVKMRENGARWPPHSAHWPCVSVLFHYPVLIPFAFWPPSIVQIMILVHPSSHSDKWFII